MYTKLPVSSLETKAARGDEKARSELVSRANAGLRRATLALERLAKRARSNRHVTQIPKYKVTTTPTTPEMIPEQMNQLIKTIEAEEFAKYGNLTAQQIYDRDRR